MWEAVGSWISCIGNRLIFFLLTLLSAAYIIRHSSRSAAFWPIHRSKSKLLSAGFTLLPVLPFEIDLCLTKIPEPRIVANLVELISVKQLSEVGEQGANALLQWILAEHCVQFSDLRSSRANRGYGPWIKHSHKTQEHFWR